jgi:hypothetical protein
LQHRKEQQIYIQTDKIIGATDNKMPEGMLATNFAIKWFSNFR